MASLTSTCRRHDLDPQLYLTQSLTSLPNVRRSELPNWASGPVEAASSATLAFVAPVLHIALTEILRYLQSIVEKGGLTALRDGIFCSSYTVVWTLWKIETAVSNV